MPFLVISCWDQNSGYSGFGCKGLPGRQPLMGAAPLDSSAKALLSWDLHWATPRSLSSAVCRWSSRDLSAFDPVSQSNKPPCVWFFMFSVRVNFTLGHVDVHVDVQTHWFAILPLPHTFFWFLCWRPIDLICVRLLIYYIYSLGYFNYYGFGICFKIYIPNMSKSVL